MHQSPNVDSQQRLVSFLDNIGNLLGNPNRRAGFAAYATGLMGSSERKSTEPIAALMCPEPKKIDAAHQRLLHFVGQSEWQDAPIREFSTEYALEQIKAHEEIEAWIFDDTGFLKQGKHSVGVQRQYTGSAGKVANCQIGVSLTLCAQTMHLPVDFELYLPRTWTDDSERRRTAKIPSDIEFRTKPELALAMAKRAIGAGLPKGLVLADAAYGNNGHFRVGLRKLGLPYAVDIEGSTKVRVLDNKGLLNKKEQSAKSVGLSLGIGRYQKVSWRQGSNKPLWSWFSRCRVVIEKDAKKLGLREEVWLLIEWPRDESTPTKFTLVTLPKKTSLVELVRKSRQRWRTERMYEDMKGELGLDHFEGRGYPGWHHHVTVALSCYAFVVAELARSFPPTAGRSRRDKSQRSETRAPLPGLFHHRSARGRTQHRSLATALPNVPAAKQSNPTKANPDMTQ